MYVRIVNKKNVNHLTNDNFYLNYHFYKKSQDKP